MASLQQEASGALGVHYSASHSGSKAGDVNARVEEEFADLLSQDKYCFDSEYEQCLSSRGFEYKQGSAPIVYKDRLRSKVDFWVSIGSSPWVLYIIRFGYRIPFISWPPRAFFCNNRSALDHVSFVDSAISDLLLAGSVIEVFTPPTVVNPLTVSVNSVGKRRLILDLRHVNKFIPKVKFKMEDSRTFLNYVHSPGYMFKFDMKSGYHHVSIHEESQTFLGFQWPLGSSVEPRFFVFAVLPFGLSSAPYVFTKVFRPLVKHWRSRGIPLVLYLDDGAGCPHDFSVAQSTASAVRSDLANAGVVANEEKSIWVPTQVLEWLGIVWDLSRGRIFIPHRRIVKLLRALLSLKSGSRSVTPRAVASVTGQIISLTPGYGNITLLMSRFLQSFVKLHSGWDCPLDFRSYQFFSECLQEIDFWLSNCARLNGRSLSRYSLPVTLVYSDASSFACGGCAFRVDSEEFDLFFQAFSSLESGLDSNARELLAILYGLKSFRASLTGKVVKVFTDSKNAASISAKGSNSLRLHALALEIFAYCAAHDISLEVEWIPRSLNSYADSVSRVVDYDDWAVSTIFFQHVSSIFGPFDVDRFASSLSAKCERFYSKFWCPGCEGVDAFSASWGGVNNYLVPPVFLVARTLAHLETSRARGTLIAPKWPSASFWPYLFPLGHPRDSVSRIIEFSDPSGIFDDSHLGFPTIFSAFGFRAPVLVIYLDASSRV